MAQSVDYRYEHIGPLVEKISKLKEEQQRTADDLERITREINQGEMELQEILLHHNIEVDSIKIHNEDKK